jgi:hypothetical protein
VKFEFYYPHDYVACPYILLICRNTHNHAPPRPTKTPEYARRILQKLLCGLGWRLADATPRRLNIDSAFIGGLREVLEWDQLREPTLGDLHPSLGNADHAARLIDEARNETFPHGSGFEGQLEKFKTLIHN